MISDSVPWKDELIAISARLRKLAQRSSLSERAQFRLERDVMVGAYAVRRLTEARKLSTRLPSSQFKVLAYPHRGNVPSYRDHDELDRYYDFGAGTPFDISLRDLSNQIIHSFVFAVMFDGDERMCVGVASDKDKAKRLYVVTVAGIASLFDYIGREDILEVVETRDFAERRSNHDLVEAGLASYGDAIETWVNERDYLFPEVGSRDLRDLVEGRRTVRRESHGTLPPLPGLADID